MRAVLQRTRGRGSGCDDAALLAQSRIDGIGGCSRKGVVLGVEVDVFDALGTDRLKGAQAHVERDRLNLDAASTKLVEDPRVKWSPAVGAAEEPGSWEKTVW